jgi:hypothetical protein
MDSRTGLELLGEKRSLLPFPGIEARVLGRLARSLVIIETSQLMLFGELISVSSEIISQKGVLNFKNSNF